MRLRALILILIVGAAVAVGRRRLDVVEVRGRSMAPTLVPGDRLLVVRASPRPGVVVLAPDPRHPARELVKRVAAIDARGVVLHGDNPTASTDARSFGHVPHDAVAWRAILRIWPLSRVGRGVGRAPDTEALDPPLGGATHERGGISAALAPRFHR